jgi:CheY-like chemotaxis protein
VGRHEVSVVHDGHAALERTATFQPEIVLLDIGLPRMNGYEVARRLRQQPEFSRTVLVALTGYGTDSDRRRSLEAGFDEHLVKPPSLESLRQLALHPRFATELCP